MDLGAEYISPFDASACSSNCSMILPVDSVVRVDVVPMFPTWIVS
jgi:hypothetical protein